MKDNLVVIMTHMYVSVCGCVVELRFNTSKAAR